MKRILVGLDGSPRSPYVLSVAVAIAKAQSAKLVLMRSVGIPPEVPQDLWRTSDQPLIDVLTATAATYLEQQAASVPKDLLERNEVVLGVAWGALCDAAKKDRSDLLVIGSHGYSGLDHLMGTTAAKIVNHAPCSVLVVREPAAAK
jgi:nucleotide-binding universal stress UspA family protein